MKNPKVSWEVKYQQYREDKRGRFCRALGNRAKEELQEFIDECDKEYIASRTRDLNHNAMRGR